MPTLSLEQKLIKAAESMRKSKDSYYPAHCIMIPALGCFLRGNGEYQSLCMLMLGAASFAEVRNAEVGLRAANDEIAIYYTHPPSVTAAVSVLLGEIAQVANYEAQFEEQADIVQLKSAKEIAQQLFLSVVLLMWAFKPKHDPSQLILDAIAHAKNS